MGIEIYETVAKIIWQPKHYLWSSEIRVVLANHRRNIWIKWENKIQWPWKNSIKNGYKKKQRMLIMGIAGDWVLATIIQNLNMPLFFIRKKETKGY